MAAGVSASTASLARIFGMPGNGNARLVVIAVGSAVATGLAAVAVARLSLGFGSLSSSSLASSSPRRGSRGGRGRKIIESPRGGEESGELGYPFDSFPGGRDVYSDYGTIRVYEWGPSNGRKVLLLHGISTPCVALGGIAHGLVAKGCRVILMDLFGRGYSDSPDLPHDSRLYSTQVLLAITSSPLAWTPEGFSLIGYSLGGGIAVDVAVAFPRMITALVLLAPGGLIRSHHFGWKSRLLYSSWFPEGVREGIVRRRLQGASVHSSSGPKKSGDAAEEAVSAEVKGNRDPDFESAPLWKDRPGVTVASVVQWQVENHEGFVRSFISSIRNASIEGQREKWARLRDRNDKILIVVGVSDSVIVHDELKEDAFGAIGADKIEWRVIDAGHEFPITKSEEVVAEISAAWGL